ncbi:DUF5329 domain-containing protein [Litoribrevibacter albus]|uniref:DUF5329 domain-containing protein n=1 Tax=Litoribrevibacter albus TaxID=1473156 RepID=A0AA37W5M0_9GAMM|nr:DUF5329 domain-containing protein [Litoribrevibacter albus]GLQ31362.1 hypothetical protein GCM10007876_18410 [Litoribrevibacter albus]
MKHVKLLSVVTLLLPLYGYASDLNPETEKQINHLLSFVSASSCKFMRNSTWHEATDAADHIKKKYDYVLGKGLVDTPEDFIKYSATKSSLSGRKYKVKCGAEPEIESSEWLLTELALFRSTEK